MGCSSSHLSPKPNNPLQELQFKESQRERTRKQQEKQKKQIARLQKKQAKKQRKKKRSNSVRASRDLATNPVIRVKQHSNDEGSGAEIPMRYDFRREEFNRQLEAKIQKHLNEDLCAFILNQSAMAMQFFKNYESELSTISDDLLAKEKELNQNLEEHSILLTNPLDVAVAKWINYKPIHGPDKHHSQPLQPQTIYMVFENIDIARPNDANYDSILPLCKVNMEMDFRETTPCKCDHLELLSDIKWKGYVRLRLREDAKSNQTKSMPLDAEDIYSEASSGYSTASPYGSKTALNLMGKVSGTGDDNGDYDYAFITHLNTLHPLGELKMSNDQERRKIDAKVLPDSCISAMGNFVQPLQEEEFTDDEDASESESDGYDNDEGETNGYGDRQKGQGYRDYDTLQAIKLYRIELEKRRRQLAQNYLNSREFMRYFGELVRKTLAGQLQITDKDLDMATFRGSSIYTSKYEIIPAVHVAQNVTDWPECAFEFRLRNRPLSTNPQTGQQIQWPTRAMVKRIETFGFHVIPLGYAPKKRRNPFRDIEWRIVFPKAERYLEQHLTNGQIKVFMITKALLKSFVEPFEKNKSLMFALDHLRTHLFWECERDYNAWPEEFLGDVLIRFLESFKRRVKEKRLPDFFVRERNLFESIPEYSLNNLYMILSDITANLLMHLMIALRNLDFAENYFPKLDIKKLYENLVENDMVKLKLLAKHGRSLMHLVQDEEEESCLMIDEGAKGLVGLKQHHVRTNGKLRRKTHLLRHNIEVEKSKMRARRRSTDSIDVEFFFQKEMNSVNMRQINQGVENLRRTNILEILIDQFIAMCAKAIEYRSVVLAKNYIMQVRRLCKCYHNYGCDVGAKEYLAKIHNLDEELQIIYSQEDFSEAAPPSLPRRFSIEPNGSNSDKSQRMSADIKNEVESFNLYSELNKKLSSSAVSRSSYRPNETAIREEECSTIILTQGRNSPRDMSTSVTFTEPRKSIKFLNEVIEVREGEMNPIQKPQGYSPVGILRAKSEPINEINDSDCEDLAPEDLPDKSPPAKPPSISTAKKSSCPSFLKSSADFLKTSPLVNSELFQNVTQNTKKIINQMASEEKRTEIREILKLQLKGLSNHSSDS